jgi:hypothetical protein
MRPTEISQDEQWDLRQQLHEMIPFILVARTDPGGRAYRGAKRRAGGSAFSS